MRFGDVARVQGSGLLLAWPRPIEQIVVLPAPARQIQFHIDPLCRRRRRRDAWR